MAASKFNFTPRSSISQQRVQIGVDEQGAPILISWKNHEKLVKHIIDRMDASKSIRDAQADKLAEIDREVYGYLLLDQDDKQREKENLRGAGIKPTDTKLPLVWAILDEARTFMASVLAPDDSMYQAIAPKEHQAQAKAFAALMNKHGTFFGHYVAYLRFIFDCLKYNEGGFSTEWKKVWGNQLNSGTGGMMQVVRQIVFEGNKIESLDLYNFFHDSSCHPTELNLEGEYFALVDRVSSFKLDRMEENGEIFEFSKRGSSAQLTSEYYRSKPIIRSDRISHVKTDWISALTLGQHSQEELVTYERIRFTGWIRPADFGLPTRENKRDRTAPRDKKGKYEIWKFTLVNNKAVCSAVHLNNAHGMLPVNISMPNEDGFEFQTKSHAEHLIPFQSYGSFLMNVAQRADRKALIGLTVYNKKYFPNLETATDALIGGKLAADVQGNDDVDLRKHFLQFNDVPDTSQAIKTIDQMYDFMQVIMPTNMLRQVSSLERATQYQAASTVQSGNKRNLTIARIIYIQAMARGHHQQMNNIFQFQPKMQLLTDEGELIDVDPVEFRDLGLEFRIADGLRGLDNLALQLHMKEILNATLQSQQASQQIDIVGFINYFTGLLGDNTDFSQFRIKSPLDVLPPEQKNLAFQLLQQFINQQQGGAAPPPSAPALPSP